MGFNVRRFYFKSIEHRTGSRMKHVDALSRYPVMFVTTNEILAKMKKAQYDDGKVALIIKVLEREPYEDYFLKSGLLYKSQNGLDLVVVPESMHDEIIRTIHQKCHVAASIIKQQIKQEYFIPNLRSKVEHCIANCISCILTNRKTGKREGFSSSYRERRYAFSHIPYRSYGSVTLY